jgi:hypothetical protein
MCGPSHPYPAQAGCFFHSLLIPLEDPFEIDELHIAASGRNTAQVGIEPGATEDEQAGGSCIMPAGNQQCAHPLETRNVGDGPAPVGGFGLSDHQNRGAARLAALPCG